MIFQEPRPVSAANTTISANPASITANGTSTSTLTVQAKDANNNNLSTSGGTVTLSATAGSLGSVTDNWHGTYTATLTSSTTAGTANITGTIAGATIGHPTSVAFSPGPLSAANTTISANPSSIVANGTSTSTLTVQARDANNNNLTLSGGTVTLNTSAGSVGSVTDNGDGTYTATLTSSTNAGVARITGTIAGTGIGNPTSVTFTAPLAANVLVEYLFNNSGAPWDVSLTSTGITASAIEPTPTYTWFWNATVSPGLLQLNSGTVATNLSQAVAYPLYVSFTLSSPIPMDLSTLTLDGGYLQNSSPAGYGVQSSMDGYASIISTANFTAQLPTNSTCTGGSERCSISRRFEHYFSYLRLRGQLRSHTTGQHRRQRHRGRLTKPAKHDDYRQSVLNSFRWNQHLNTANPGQGLVQ